MRLPRRWCTPGLETLTAAAEAGVVVEKAWLNEGVTALVVVVVVGGNIVVMGMKCRVGARVPIEGRRRHLQQLGEAMVSMCQPSLPV